MKLNKRHNYRFMSSHKRIAGCYVRWFTLYDNNKIIYDKQESDINMVEIFKLLGKSLIEIDYYSDEGMELQKEGKVHETYTA